MNLHKCQKSVKNTNDVDENKNLSPCFGSPSFHLFFQLFNGFIQFPPLANIELINLNERTSIIELQIPAIKTNINVIIFYFLNNKLIGQTIQPYINKVKNKGTKYNDGIISNQTNIDSSVIAYKIPNMNAKTNEANTLIAPLF